MEVSTKFPRKRIKTALFIYRKKIQLQFSYKIVMLLCFIFSFSALQNLQAQGTITSARNGLWNSTSTWIGGVIPSTSDNVVIKDGDIVELTANTTCASLLIKNDVANTTSTLDFKGFTLNTGTITLDPYKNGNTRVQIKLGAGTIITSGDIICKTPTNYIDFIADSTSTVRYNGSTQSIGALPYGNLIIEGTGTKFLTDDIAITGNLIVETGSTLHNGGKAISGMQGNTFQVKAGATFITETTGAATMPLVFTNKILDSGSTVRFNSSSTQNIPLADYTYGNIIISSDHKVRPDREITPANVTGNITVYPGAIFDNNGKNITGTPTQTFEVQNGGTFITTTATALPSGYGNLDFKPSSTINFAGSTNQAIPSRTYGNITISNAEKTLAGNVTATKVNFTGGALNLANYDLTMPASTNLFTSQSATNYIKQTGTGKLIIEGLGTGGITSEVTFPVGTATSYTPAYITNAGPQDNFSVKVEDNIKDNFNTIVTNNVVKKTWNVVKETNNGTADVTLRLQWSIPDEGTDFLRNQVGIANKDGGTWQQPLLSSFTDGSTTFLASRSNISSFSSFGVVNPNNPLPVELISFTVTKKENAAYLQWTTASEKNNEGFHIQTSTDGKNFENIGFIASHNPNSVLQQQYEFLDKTNSSGLRYYRLKQTDFDGQVSYSAIKVINFDLRKSAPLIYPNPFNEQINFSIEAEKNEELRYQLVDLTGKTVFESTQKLMKGNNTIQINLDERHPAGVYLLKTQTSDSTTSTRLLRQ